MVKNYLKTAWRALVNKKPFTIINILGLGLGMACSLLIILWVQDEINIDAFHKNGNRLYQVYERNYFGGKVEAGYPTQGLLADELRRLVPEIKYASAMDYASSPGTANTFEVGDKVEKMKGYFAGADFFSMFSYPLMQGKPEAALNTAGGIAISRKMAVLFFGSPEKAFGKAIRFDNNEELMVTAVFEDLPVRSSQQFDFLRTWTDYVKANDWVQNWGSNSPATFIQLQTGADAGKVEAKIKDFIYRYKERNKSFITELALQPYPEKYLHSLFKNGRISGGRIEYVRLFTWVAIFILLIACINFMNLATAQSAKRAKEVGVRKVMGAIRSSLIGQFISEAVVLAFVSVFVALVLVSLVLPGFNNLTGKQLALPFTQVVFWIALVLLALVTGVFAGTYPAIFLSSLNPVTVFKSSVKFSWANIFIRKGLVVFQFALSILLIMGMIVIYRQVEFIQKKNIGYDRENLVYIPIEGELSKKYALFKQQALKTPGVLDISKMRNSPTVIEHHTGGVTWSGKDPNQVVSFADAVVGYDFVKTMKLQIKEGRDFSDAFGTDSTGFLLNETAVIRMGYKNPVGQSISWGNRQGKIIGVIKDFHFNSMHETIDPLIVRLDENWTWGTILVRASGDKTKEVVDGLNKLCKSLNPGFPFTYQFSDQEYARLYQSEKIVSRLSGYFAFLAIFISCLGLFGLATFTAAQRTKEIGVRKVLGASVPDIISLLSGNFLKLVLVAMLISFPVAWFAMSSWLQNFAYKIDIEWWMFVTAGLLTIGIALLTVSYQSIKAAISNPVKSLRTE